MELNRDTLERLMAMSDRQLKFILSHILAEAGIDIGQGLTDADIVTLRRAAANVTDAELLRIGEIIEALRK